MKRSIFVLGFARSLCEAELIQVWQNLGLSYKILLSNATYLDVLSDPFSEAELMQRLGGTVKIATFLKQTDFTQDLVGGFISELDIVPNTSIGLSNYSSHSVSAEKILKYIKEKLKKKGIKVRFVVPQHNQQLSTIVIKKQKIREFILTDGIDKGTIIISETVAISDSEAWSKRDFGRPEADPKSGMLPLKVARMMLNLVSTKSKIKNQKSKLVLLDPFCGMGTILGEALLLGYSVIGSDISTEVIGKAKKNVEFLQGAYTISPDRVKLLTSNAVHVSKVLVENSIDVIVTEPFLGAPFEERYGVLYQKSKPVTQHSVKNTIKGLEKLFIGGFKEWHKLLKPEGILVIALPSIAFAGKKTAVKSVIDNCETLGYTLLQGPYEYARPNAVVKRNIYVFKKN